MERIIHIEEVKRIQLDILSALDEFCRSNNIQYTIIDGTLLGAVRHGGYIPWDDDIDVAMERKNYDLFIQLFPSLYEGKYKLASLECDKQWDRAYGCMYDDRTKLVYRNNSSVATGILIDIFPIDEVPDSEVEWERLKKKILFYNKLSALKSSTSFRVSQSVIKNIFAGILKILLKPISKRKVAEWHDRMARSYNGKGYRCGYETTFGLGALKRFKLADLRETIVYSFEDRFFRGIKNYHSVLTDIYGDYMKLPPEEKRISHHSFEAYWK